MVSRAFDEDHFYYTGRITFEEFLNISNNVITTSACLASPLNKLDMSHPMYKALVNKYDFLEIQAHNHPDQIEFNKKLLQLSWDFNKPLIAGTDTHSSSKYKAECRSKLLKSKHKSYGDEDAFDLSFKTYDELVEMFEKQGALQRDEYIKAIENTNVLEDMIEDFEIDTAIKYPILYGSPEQDAEKYVELVNQEFDRKVSEGIIPAEQVEGFTKAIDEEISVFKKLDMCGFMLGVSELVTWCKDNDLVIGLARGSVGGSRTAYITNIIDLNPETWNTVFSRFCNENRVEPGDIDLDCIESDRPQIFKHIIERFGDDKTGRVASFGTMQSKGVIDDVGRALAMEWEEANKNANSAENPWSLSRVSGIKDEFDKDPEATKEKYPELFYYYDGMIGTKISQSVHPAGMVISPVTLRDNYGMFNKDGENCLFLDMDWVHECGLIKYDFLALKTLKVIRDTCKYIHEPYPKSHEVNWNDEAVWDDVITSPSAIFQFEGRFAFESLRKFKPRDIFEMSLVTAAIRPSGASYRDDLLARRIHKNPSEEIDELLKESNSYLVYQEQIIMFLQQMCGYSGGDADSVRRMIAKKKPEELERIVPEIINGYCEKSSKDKETATKEAEEFVKIIEDASSYMFGYNHSIGYCLLSYLCAYYRYYHPYEFITAFLNNAMNDDDIVNGTEYAKQRGIAVTIPKWGISRSNYAYDVESKTIAKGLESIKYISKKSADELFELASNNKYTYFTDVLYDLDRKTSIDTRQIDILIKIDFFSEFGNQRELLYITNNFYELFKKGNAKQINKEKIAYTLVEPIVQKYAVGTTKKGEESKSYTLLDIDSILHEIETAVKAQAIQDFDDITKVKNVQKALGYLGYVSGNEEDRRKLLIMDKYPLKRKKDGKQFGYHIKTKSIGSGKEAQFTLFNMDYNLLPVNKGDIIYCRGFERDGKYFILKSYNIVSQADE